MRGWTAGLVAALVLTACDAGHSTPGSDNVWPGPELDIQVPGPGTTIAVAWPAPEIQSLVGADGQVASIAVPQSKPRPKLFFRLRPMGEHGQLQVRYAIDDGVFHTLSDATKATTLEEELAPGTRLVSAYLVRTDGTPRFGARATSVSTFVLEVADAASGQTLGAGGTPEYGYVDPERRWQPFDPAMPCLLVEVDGDRIHVLAHRCELDGEHHRVRYAIDGADGVIAGANADTGRFGATLPAAATAAVEIVLEAGRQDGAHVAWNPVPGSRGTFRRAGP